MESRKVQEIWKRLIDRKTIFSRNRFFKQENVDVPSFIPGSWLRHCRPVNSYAQLTDKNGGSQTGVRGSHFRGGRQAISGGREGITFLRYVTNTSEHNIH